MATTKQRLNITLSPRTKKLVREISRRDKMPEATKVSILLDKALEIEEDILWVNLATHRSTEKSKHFTHKEAWR